MSISNLSLILLSLILLSCNDKSNRTSIGRVNNLAIEFFGSEIEGDIAKSGEKNNALVIFNIKQVPSDLLVILNSSKNLKCKDGIKYKGFVILWYDHLNHWVVANKNRKPLYVLKIEPYKDLKTVVLMER